MKHVLDQMLRIKRLREDKAERMVHAQQRAVQQAEARRDDAEHCLQAHREHAGHEERRLYRSLCERVVRVRELDHVRDQVMCLRAQELQHADALTAAEDQVLEEQAQLAADREAHRQALRLRDKFIELAGNAAQAERAEAERKEEAAIEEAAETRRPVHA